MNLEKWTEDAEIFAEEVLEPADYRKLERSAHKASILKEVATAGMGVYRSMMEEVPAMMERGLDQFAAQEVARDYSQESMRAALAQQMEKVIPGFQKMYR